MDERVEMSMVELVIGTTHYLIARCDKCGEVTTVARTDTWMICYVCRTHTDGYVWLPIATQIGICREYQQATAKLAELNAEPVIEPKMAAFIESLEVGL